MSIPDFRVCPRCGIEKGRGNFSTRKGGRFLRTNCKECDNKLAKKYFDRNPEQTKRQNRFMRYRIFGITEQIFNEKLESQTKLPCATSELKA